MIVRALFLWGLCSVCAGCEDTEAKLRFYYESLDDYYELPLSGAQEIFSGGWYNVSRPTTIVTHGFTGGPSGRAVQALAGAYLRRGHNVALLDWQCGAANNGPSYGAAYLNWAVPNAIQLGVEFADVVRELARAGLALATTRLVGHSLGAHVFGITGNQLARTGVLLPCIIGLDPSGTAWDRRPAALRLSAGAAALVLALHTDPDHYGTRLAAGTLDFWPNARATRVLQPGCAPRRGGGGGGGMFSDKDLCSHNRSWQLLAEATARPGSVVGVRAKNYRDWKTSRGRGEEVVADLGECDTTALPGNYYLMTRAAAPYGLGEAGLRPRDNGTRPRPPRPAYARTTSINFGLH